MRSKRIWAVLFVFIAACSVAAVVRYSGSAGDVFGFVRGADIFCVAAAVLCMLLFIFFEGAALRTILSSFGCRAGLPDCAVYSATDIYFSAITPSASGGQPACALMMMRGGVPGPTATVALIWNILLYKNIVKLLYKKVNVLLLKKKE